MEREHGDNLDLRMTTIGQKLEAVGYDCFWVGKGGGEGWASNLSLAVNRGFKAGYYGAYDWDQMERKTKANYYGKFRWDGAQRIKDHTYSTHAFWRRAHQFVHAFENSTDSKKRMFLFINPQATHVPYDEMAEPPKDSATALDGSTQLRLRILEQSDIEMGKVVDELKARNFWRNTLFVYSSDNGGCGGSTNYPLRGQKMTNWEGGVRVAAFVAGGVLPEAALGRYEPSPTHISDWYATFCYLAGAVASDKSSKAPAKLGDGKEACLRHGVGGVNMAPADVTMKGCPRTHNDRYGTESYPDIDSQNVWPQIAKLSAEAWVIPSELLATRVREEEALSAEERALVQKTGRALYLTENAFVLGKYKLHTGFPDLVLSELERLYHDFSEAAQKKGRAPNSGWQEAPNASSTPEWDQADHLPVEACESIGVAQDGTPLTPMLKPCLFDVEADPSETKNIASSNPDVLQLMWKMLNQSNEDRYLHGVTPDDLRKVPYPCFKCKGTSTPGSKSESDDV